MSRKEDPLTPRQALDAPTIIEIIDERSREAEEALGLIHNCFPRSDRHAISELRSEIAEKRHLLLEPFDFHQLAVLDENESVIATAAGVYLAGVNAGFVTYLVVGREHRNRQLGRMLRAELVDRFRANSLAAEYDDLKWVLGEVRIDSPWLITLVKTGTVIPFDLEYFHPGLQPGTSERRYVLYREIIADDRRSIPAGETAQVLFAIYRRAYRVRYPLERENFKSMIDQLQGREEVGPNREVMRLAGIETL